MQLHQLWIQFPRFFTAKTDNAKTKKTHSQDRSVQWHQDCLWELWIRKSRKLFNQDGREGVRWQTRTRLQGQDDNWLFKKHDYWKLALWSGSHVCQIFRWHLHPECHEPLQPPLRLFSRSLQYRQKALFLINNILNSHCPIKSSWIKVFPPSLLKSTVFWWGCLPLR